MMSETRILIADDHKVVIEGIKAGLRDYPELVVVAEACNGREAIDKIGVAKPHVVITDISMPELNGIDATLQIKKINSEIKIIVYSMYSNREFIVDLFKAGISAYVLKEDPMNDLILAIQSVRTGGYFFSTRAPTILLQHLENLEKGVVKKDPFKALSYREREVFQLLAEGKNVKEIAKKLAISHKTVETHKYNLFTKLHLETITDLIKLAIEKKIIRLDKPMR